MRAPVKKLVFAAIILAIGLWWLLSYHKSEFKGDGTISDTGAFTFPRYHVKLGTLPLSEPAEHIFKVSGLPPEPLDLQLYILGTGQQDRSALVQLNTYLDVDVADGSGRSLCSGSGRLSAAERRDETGWVLKGGNSVAAAFWHSKCLGLP